ncbi:MAG TPA: vWA domain-containing protein, partial [Archangium sp.]
VYLLFRVTTNEVFVAGAVSTVSQFRANQIALSDLTNGTHLSDPAGLLTYDCETIPVPPLKTDFIFVVDNSASMLEEQTALANSADALFQAFSNSGLDFRIGVITTDSDVLRGTGFTSDLQQFKSDVRVGINGNGFEMGVEFALRAIRIGKLAMDPSRRIREDAGLVVVFVTDEENAGLRPVASYAADYIAEKAVAFGIVGPRPIGCTRVGLGAAVAGTEYIDLAAATGGSTGSICNPNLTEVVEEILFGAIGASSRARLMDRPISGSLQVKTDMLVPRARQNGFDYDPANNTVLFFGASPPAGTDVTAGFATWFYLN